MPLPLAPIAGVALRYGAVALVGFAATRLATRRPAIAPRDQMAEDAHDRAEEGLAARRDPGQMNGTARFKRTIRLGTDGPGLEIDASALTRFRIRRLK